MRGRADTNKVPDFPPPAQRHFVTIVHSCVQMAENREEEHEEMDAPEVIDRLEDLALSGREGYVCG